MKKISLFILSVFALGVTLAQTVSDFDFVPTTTDNNMSVVFPAGTLNDFVGGSLMAFKADGSPVSEAYPVAVDGSGGNAVIGMTYASVKTAPIGGLLVEGNVGIGTSTPDLNTKLDVSGSIRGAYDTDTTSFFGRAAIGYNNFELIDLSLEINNNPSESSSNLPIG